MRPILLAPFLLLAAAAQEKPARVLVVFHSETGHTRAMAGAVRDGVASVPGVEALLRSDGEASDAEIAGADGILLGTPVHWENLSAASKRFLDRIGEVLSKRGKELGEGRTAGAFCTGGAPAAGKDLARLSILAAFLGMRFVVAGGVDAEGYGTLGPQATTGGRAALSEGELAEARRFGARFARLTARLRSATATPAQH